MSEAFASQPGDPAPAGEACPLLVNMQELALALRTSRQSLSLWVRKYPDFPIERRGSHGIGYLFDPTKVVDYLLAKKAEQERAGSERDAALAQFVLPLGEAESPPHAGPLSIKDQLDAARLSRMRREEAERLGQLVSAAELRTVLTTAIGEMQRRLRTGLQRRAEDLHLPDNVKRELAAALAEQQRLFVRELRDLLGAQDAA